MTDDSPHGMIHVYTGDGKGKTTAALGLALRAMGHGYRTFMIQFMKNPEMMGEKYGEIRATESSRMGITIRSFGRAKWIKPGEVTDEDRELAKKALELAKDVLKDPQIQVVILDEIFPAIHFGIVTIEDILDIIDNRPPNNELILTGRNAQQEILDRADLVTEMKAVKHYFDKGQQARKGVEY